MDLSWSARVHFRLSHFVAAVGAWLVLLASPASAQVLTIGGGGLQELQFVVAADGSACSSLDAFADDNIVWGTANVGSATSCTTAESDDNIVWGTLADEDNIVWGTRAVDDNIVWGTYADEDNIVWGTQVLQSSYEY